VRAPKVTLIGGALLALAAAPLLAQAPKAAGHRAPHRTAEAAGAAEADTAANALHAPGIVGAIALGEMVRGELAPGDQVMSDGTYADVWEFTATAGERVAIDLRSDEFDTYLQLLDAAGKVIGQDDDSGGDLNSHLAITLPAAGTYRIVVNSAGHEQRVGAYTLSVR
jgi:pre-peptidase